MSPQSVSINKEYTPSTFYVYVHFDHCVSVSPDWSCAIHVALSSWWPSPDPPHAPSCLSCPSTQGIHFGKLKGKKSPELDYKRYSMCYMSSSMAIANTERLKVLFRKGNRIAHLYSNDWKSAIYEVTMEIYRISSCLSKHYIKALVSVFFPLFPYNFTYTLFSLFHLPLVFLT